jgi:hypothetical protein
MEMFLMAVCLTFFGVAVSAMAFGAATSDVREQEAATTLTAKVDEALASMPERFFAHDTAPSASLPVPVASVPRIPIEVLLAQIERHVRLEHAAAESFLYDPTVESLHSRTTSPLVH